MKIDITEKNNLIELYNKIYKHIQFRNEKYIPRQTWSRECVQLSECIPKILKILGRKGILPRFGKAFYQTKKGYWIVNLENSSRLEKMGIKKTRISLHRLIYICYNGFRYNKDYCNYDTHHLCGNKECVNPNHLIMVKHDKHVYADMLRDYLLSNKGKYPPLEIRKRFYDSIGKDITDRIIKKTLEFVI